MTSVKLQMLGAELHCLTEEANAFSDERFPDQGVADKLLHLYHEVEEVMATPDDIKEYADCFLLLTDAARKAGFSIRDLIAACRDKIEYNKTRTFTKQPDGTYKGS